MRYVGACKGNIVMEVNSNLGEKRESVFPAEGLWPSCSGASCLTVVCVQAVVSVAPPIP